MTNNKSTQRPKFLNLLQIRLPVTAVASILHRISGVLLFLILPIVIYGLGMSLQGNEGFHQVKEIIVSPIGQFLIILVAITIFYHLVAGIRFLFLDIDIGHSLPVARWSARLVIVLTMIALVLMLVVVIN